MWELGLIETEPTDVFVGCVGGIALWLDNPERNSDEYGPEMARHVLGLPDGVMDRLADVQSWPATYQTAYIAAHRDGNDRARGQIAAALLRYVAETGDLD